MKILYITGCNGFIGSILMKYFSNLPEYEVYGITQGNNKIINNLIFCDYENLDFLKKIIRNNCYVIHAATYVPLPSENSKEIEVINNKIVNFIRESFKSKKVEKFFNLSSISVYGYGERELIRCTEDAEILLTNYYARSKYKNEILLSDTFKRNYNLRISSPIGKGKKKKTLVDTIIEKIINDEEVIIYCKGERKQDFIWVEDIAKVIDRMIKIDIEPGEYNLTTGTSLSVKEIISVIEKVTKKKAKVVSVNKLESPSVTISNDKLIQKIGGHSTFFTSFEEAIRKIL